LNEKNHGAEVVKSYLVGDSVDEFNVKIEQHGLPSNAMKYCIVLTLYIVTQPGQAGIEY